MAKRDDTRVEATPRQLEELIGRIERNALDDTDRALLARVVRLVLTLTELLQRKNATISRLKRMLFGPGTDRRIGAAESSPGQPEQADRADTARPSKPRAKGHGRMASSAYPGAERVTVSHEQLHGGDACPQGCGGRVFVLAEPSIHIRLEGRAPIAASRYERERLRCSSCQAVFTAPLPEDVEQAKYSASADATIAVMKYYVGVPFHRAARLQHLLGVPLPESVQFERCEVLANIAFPVYRRLEAEAAQADLLHCDDTRVRILSLRAEIERERAAGVPSLRTGLQTTAVVAKAAVPIAAPRIALYRSGRRHAGENTAALLAKRQAGAPAAIRIGDASSSNRVGRVDVVEAACWSHARRKFVELETSFPEQCGRVLDTIAGLYRIDSASEGRTPEERLALHRRHSGPVLEGLRAWMLDQFEAREVEPNSSLGSAFSYVLNAWAELTEVLRTPGVPLDNNEAERALKLVARHRTNSFFYKTAAGASVGDVLLSLVETCALNGVNPIAYLTAIGTHAREVRADPSAWTPWRWAARASPEAEDPAA